MLKKFYSKVSARLNAAERIELFRVEIDDACTFLMVSSDNYRLERVNLSVPSRINDLC